MLVAAALICTYWAAFFLSDLTKPVFVLHPTGAGGAQLAAVYLGFEGAFPLPDGFVAITLALTGFYLIAGDRSAVLFGLVGGGAMLFLGLIDIWFNVGHGFYSSRYLASDVGMQMEAAINIGCVVGPTWSIWRLWRQRLYWSPSVIAG
jgi:hypothetical protein